MVRGGMRREEVSQRNSVCGHGGKKGAVIFGLRKVCT
jgi:hypothetical protein